MRTETPGSEETLSKRKGTDGADKGQLKAGTSQERMQGWGLFCPRLSFPCTLGLTAAN